MKPNTAVLTRISLASRNDLGIKIRNFWLLFCYQILIKTRMHSSRISTVRCSGRRVCVCVSQHAMGRGWWYVSQHTLGRGCVSQHALGRGWSGQRCVCVCPEGCQPGGVCHTPCEQNHRRLWKHNLATTTLRTVIKSVKMLTLIHALLLPEHKVLHSAPEYSSNLKKEERFLQLWFNTWLPRAFNGQEFFWKAQDAILYCVLKFIPSIYLTTCVLIYLTYRLIGEKLSKVINFRHSIQCVTAMPKISMIKVRTGSGAGCGNFYPIT